MFEVALVPPGACLPPSRSGRSPSCSIRTLGATWIITYAGLSGPPTAIRLVSGDGDGTEMLSIIGNLTSPIVGGASLDQAQAALLTAGAVAVVIQSAAFPAGELRAQLIPTGTEAGAGAE